MTTPTIDDELAAAVRFTGRLRTGFYVAVLLVALAGQLTGATERLHLPWYLAAPGVGALELGGMVVLQNADVRRRLGERAVGSRLLSVGIAGFAVSFNWLSHADHLRGGFFSGMSLLGYLVWVMSSENARRDRLRAKGDLPPTSPSYGLWQWARHPWLTRRARALALRQPALGLYGSLDGAREQVRAERRRAAISAVLHRQIRQSADPKAADIATTVYDLDRIAAALEASADYAGLTALVARDLSPARLLAGEPSGAEQAADDALDVPQFMADDQAVIRTDAPHLPTPYFPWLSAGQAPIIGAATSPREVTEVPAATSTPEATATSPRKRAATSPRKSGGSSRAKKGATSPRRPIEETRQLAAELRAKNPDMTKTELARLLGITATRLRQVEKPVEKVNGSQP